MKNFITLLAITFILAACNTTGTEKEDFTVNPNSPKVSMGEIEAQFDNPFPLPGLKKGLLTLSYIPSDDAVCLQYRQDFMTYQQFWSRKGRTAYLGALGKYKEDYEARNLDSRGGGRTRRNYGIVNGYLIWQVSEFLTRANSAVNIEIGYSFKSNSPYFTLYQREGFYQDPTAEKTTRNSQQIVLYFTRAQADELAFFFDQQYLDGLTMRRTGGNAERDDYFSEGEIQGGVLNEVQPDDY